MRRHDHHGHAGLDTAQRDEAGQAADARHGEVEKDEIEIVVGGDDRARGLEVAGLENLRLAADPGKRLLQRSTKQRMIVGDHEPDACCHPILPVLRRSVADGMNHNFMLSAKQFKRRMST